jgi:Ca2+-binding RTX toxin-like protein
MAMTPLRFTARGVGWWQGDGNGDANNLEYYDDGTNTTLEGAAGLSTFRVILENFTGALTFGANLVINSAGVILGTTGNDNPLNGTAGVDHMIGLEGDDYLDAGNGSDLLYGGEGNDVIDGDSGDDTIYGGAGNDTVRGYNDADLIYGGAGNDSLLGVSGRDTLYGGEGADYLSGGIRDDWLFGGSGNDTIDGGEEDDSIDAGSGDDTIDGGDGNDTIDGGDGNDTITGDATSDTILYRLNTGSTIAAIDAGPDWIDDATSGYIADFGSNNVAGSTVVAGGTVPGYVPAGVFSSERLDLAGGSNLLYAFPAANSGLYQVNVFIGNEYALTSNPGDRIFDIRVEGSVPTEFNDIDPVALWGHRVGGYLTATVEVTDGTLNVDFLQDVIENPLLNAIEIIYLGGNDSIDAGAGNDTIDGGGGNDTIFGGSGTDSILAGDGEDVLYGGAGADTIRSTVGGSDTAYGGDGDDFIFYGYIGVSRTDVLIYGGGGNDSIQSVSNSETVYGGSGNDTIRVGNSSSEAYGGTGNDLLVGGLNGDTLDGGAGNDTIVGVGGNGIGISNRNILTGGAGADIFEYASGPLYPSQTGANRDVITDFSNSLGDGDILDMSGLLPGSFTFGGQIADTDAGTVMADDYIRFYQDVGGNLTVIQINTDGAGTPANIEIGLTGIIDLSAGDFIL